MGSALRPVPVVKMVSVKPRSKKLAPQTSQGLQVILVLRVNMDLLVGMVILIILGHLDPDLTGLDIQNSQEGFLSNLGKCLVVESLKNVQLHVKTVFALKNAQCVKVDIVKQLSNKFLTLSCHKAVRAGLAVRAVSILREVRTLENVQHHVKMKIV
jgi:hypothetical protein